jgi:hypothetical protein
VGPVPDPLLLRKSVSAGNRTRTSGSVARNSDHRWGQNVAIKGKILTTQIDEKSKDASSANGNK